MKQRTIFVGLISATSLVVVAAVVVMALASRGSGSSAKEKGRGVSHPPAPPQPVTSMPTQPAGTDEARVITLPAILEADNTADLYAKVSGYVDQLNVDIGSRVRAGDVLLRITIPEMDDELHQSEAQLGAKRANTDALKAKVVQAQLAIASARAEQKRFEAELALSRITCNRKTELFKAKAIPEQEFDDASSRLAVSEAQLLTAQAAVAGEEGAERAAQADVKAAEAQVALAAADVARLKTLMAYEAIKAPFNGVITRRNVNVGWFVRSAAQAVGPWLLTLDKVDVLRVVIYVPEAQARFVRIGTQVEIHIQSLDGPPIHSAVTRTAVATRPDTRAMRAEVDVRNEDGRLSPGMYAKVLLRTQRSLTNR
jgi:HlyD family secretion protein